MGRIELMIILKNNIKQGFYPFLSKIYSGKTMLGFSLADTFLSTLVMSKIFLPWIDIRKVPCFPVILFIKLYLTCVFPYLSLYEKIPVTENRYSGIFYTVVATYSYCKHSSNGNAETYAHVLEDCSCVCAGSSKSVPCNQNSIYLKLNWN